MTSLFPFPSWCFRECARDQTGEKEYKRVSPKRNTNHPVNPLNQRNLPSATLASKEIELLILILQEREEDKRSFVVDYWKFTRSSKLWKGDGSSRRERADTVGETFEIDSRGDEVLYLQK